jgi:hypothetical protein
MVRSNVIADYDNPALAVINTLSLAGSRYGGSSWLADYVAQNPRFDEYVAAFRTSNSELSEYCKSAREMG